MTFKALSICIVASRLDAESAHDRRIVSHCYILEVPRERGTSPPVLIFTNMGSDTKTLLDVLRERTSVDCDTFDDTGISEQYSLTPSLTDMPKCQNPLALLSTARQIK